MPCQNEMKLILVLAERQTIENYFFKLGTQELFEIYITLESISIRSQFDAFLCASAMLFDAQCWPGIVLAKLSAWFRAGMLSAPGRRVGDAVGPASSWQCVRPSIEMATLSAQRRAGDAVGPASSCDGDGNAVGPASDDTVAAVSWRRCLPSIVLVTLSAAGDTVRVSLAYRPGVVLSAQHRFGLR